MSDGCLSWPAEGICQRRAGTKSPAGAGLLVLITKVERLAYNAVYLCLQFLHLT